MVFGDLFSTESSRTSSRSSAKTKLRIKLLDEIGSGSYAKVYQATRLNEAGVEDGQNYAAKVIDTKSAPKDFTGKFLPRELEISKLVNHENVIKTFDIVKQGRRIILLMDYANKGDLLAYCRLLGAMPESRSKPIFRQLVLGVEYLHDMRIIHRDLKCENILLCGDAPYRVLITDLGFARFLDGVDNSRTFCGSAAYAAPELLRGRPYTGFGPDIWSMGCILFVMACHMMPYRDDNVKILMNEQKQPLIYPNQIRDSIAPMLKTFIGELLTYDLAKRPDIKQIKSSPWLL